jgi:DEAD/DEAH box helicase
VPGCLRAGRLRTRFLARVTASLHLPAQSARQPATPATPASGLYSAAPDPDDVYKPAGDAEHELFTAWLQEDCGTWLSNQNATPMRHLLCQAASARVIAQHAPARVRLSWGRDRQGQDNQTLTYGVTRVTLDGLRGMFRGMVLDAERFLAERLLLERVPAAGDARAERAVLGQLQELLPPGRLRSLYDDGGCLDRDYNFVSDPANGLAPLGELVHKRINRTARLAREWLVDRGGGEREISQAAARAYLDDVADFMRQLLLLVHLTGGMPPRGTEAIGVRVRNDCGPRDVNVSDGSVMVITRYSKTQRTTGRSRATPRFLPPRVSRLLVLYLAAVEPFAHGLRRVQLAAQRGEGARPKRSAFLFHDGDGAAWPAKRLCAELQREARRRLGCRALHSRAWRQMCKAIAQRCLGYGGELASLHDDRGGDDEGGGEEEGGGGAQMDTGLHYQFGHGVAVGSRLYGQMRDDADGLTTRSRMVLQDFSARFHRFFRLDGDDPAAADGVAAVRAVRPPRAAAYAPAVSDEDLTAALVRLYGAGAGFRGDHQERAVRAVVQHHAPNVAVVLPTAGGKSALFLLPALAERSLITVVVVPSVGLLQDLAARCAAARIDRQIWELGEDGEAPALRPPLVLVSADKAASDGFVGALLHSERGRRVRRIIYDERHILSSQRTLRRRLEDLSALRDCQCQHVLLSATLPPRELEDLQDVLGLGELGVPAVLRAPQPALPRHRVQDGAAGGRLHPEPGARGAGRRPPHQGGRVRAGEERGGADGRRAGLPLLPLGGLRAERGAGGAAAAPRPGARDRRHQRAGLRHRRPRRGAGAAPRLAPRPAGLRAAERARGAGRGARAVGHRHLRRLGRAAGRRRRRPQAGRAGDARVREHQGLPPRAADGGDGPRRRRGGGAALRGPGGRAALRQLRAGGQGQPAARGGRRGAAHRERRRAPAPAAGARGGAACADGRPGHRVQAEAGQAAQRLPAVPAGVAEVGRAARRLQLPGGRRGGHQGEDARVYQAAGPEERGLLQLRPAHVPVQQGRRLHGARRQELHPAPLLRLRPGPLPAPRQPAQGKLGEPVRAARAARRARGGPPALAFPGGGEVVRRPARAEPVLDGPQVCHAA